MIGCAYCVWEEIPDRPGFQWCPNCGRPRGWPRGQTHPSPLPARLLRACIATPATPPNAPRSQPPSMTQRVANYRDAHAKWNAAGCPVRSDERMLELYETKCHTNQCGQFNGLPLALGGECKACGCGLHPERKLLNKLYWATEACPKGLFQADVDPPKPIHRDQADEDGSRAG